MVTSGRLLMLLSFSKHVDSVCFPEFSDDCQRRKDSQYDRDLYSYGMRERPE